MAEAEATSAHAPTIPVPVASRALHEKYASQVKSRLAGSEITVQDARDGILDCFLSTYHHGVSIGLKGIVGLDGTEEEVTRVTTSLFRRRLRDLGSDFDAPSLQALEKLKEVLDRELHYVELPVELRGVHDQVCSLLLARASRSKGARPVDGTVDVMGPTSAVTAETTTVFRRPGVPLAPAGGPVAAQLRAALVTHLQGLVEATSEGAGSDELNRELERAGRLVAALQAFERP